MTLIIKTMVLADLLQGRDGLLEASDSLLDGLTACLSHLLEANTTGHGGIPLSSKTMVASQSKDVLLIQQVTSCWKVPTTIELRFPASRCLLK